MHYLNNTTNTFQQLILPYYTYNDLISLRQIMLAIRIKIRKYLNVHSHMFIKSLLNKI